MYMIFNRFELILLKIVIKLFEFAKLAIHLYKIVMPGCTKYQAAYGSQVVPGGPQRGINREIWN